MPLAKASHSPEALTFKAVIRFWEMLQIGGACYTNGFPMTRGNASGKERPGAGYLREWMAAKLGSS